MGTESSIARFYGADSRRRGARARAVTANERRTPAGSAYVAGLTLLAGRDLSAAQLGDRLRRRGFTPEATDAAVARLRDEGALDDGRAALSPARRAVDVRRQGPARIARELVARGIDASVAKAAIA